MLSAQATVSTTPATSIDMRTDGAVSQFWPQPLKLVSRSPFKVECCGERTLSANLNGGGKYRLTIDADTHIGEISGDSPVYTSA